MIQRKAYLFLGVIFVSGLLLASGVLFAGAGKKGHTHDKHAMAEDTHKHDNWVKPPKKYLGKRNDRWNDEQAAIRGMAIFAEQCAQCHGLSGEGDGPVAMGLAHKPADLSHHFHAKDGVSDAYLFWRVTEGGTVDPFKSANSAMPAFKDVLTPQQRWDVLTYIHQEIHKGFTMTRAQEQRMDHKRSQAGNHNHSG